MKTKVFAANLKNNDEVLKSSSGGAYTAISNLFLDNDNAIVSALYNYESNQTEFKLFNERNIRDEARGSKYMQAKTLNIYKDAEDWLKNNNGNLLFVGMGCQAEAFRKYMEIKGYRKRIIIVDIVCHGTPSPKLWREYIEGVGNNISDLTFRDKRNGWHLPTSVAKVKGKEISLKSYINIFYNRCALRPSCYECPYATTERNSDITIGDFWGVEEALPNFEIADGVSLILVHTEAGMNVWENIKADMYWEESSVKDCLQPNLIKPTEKSPLREKFWEDYYSKGIKYIIKKYGEESLVLKIKRKLKNILKKFFNIFRKEKYEKNNSI